MMYEVAAEEKGEREVERTERAKKCKETEQVVQLCCINKARYMYFAAASEWPR